MTSRKWFKLERMLTKATIEEQSAQRVLAETNVQSAEAARSHEAECERYRESREAVKGVRSAETLQRVQELAALVARTMADAELERRRAEADAAEAHREWLAAAREKRTLERLEERDRAALAVIASRASQRAIDDLASQRRKSGIR
jgi:flagellar biosynthesis chaperone FliJ